MKSCYIVSNLLVEEVHTGTDPLSPVQWMIFINSDTRGQILKPVAEKTTTIKVILTETDFCMQNHSLFSNHLIDMPYSITYVSISVLKSACLSACFPVVISIPPHLTDF